ncbi:hypothetical protein PR003_g31862 [Phytophthora rubi]|uniref:Timeless N-terminal domain-containing protein n=1 Tax=Phytophthora rubi TaxID=129364 RepID=A0A6A4B336_9STRA|nr:hypothetical protein PR003_g31862 [Phytophthora rubi]
MMDKIMLVCSNLGMSTPLLVNHQYDWALVFSVMKVLVVLTMMPPRDSTNTAQQLLVYPLSRKGSARTG